MTTSFCTGILAIIFAIYPATALSKHLYKEKHYQIQWCNQHAGTPEVRLADGSRADCITATHAIEHDFANKWAEAIGQSMFYSIQTGKKAGIVLIMEKPGDIRYWIRLNTTIDTYNLPIDTWKMH